jgi:ferrous-iron efflux pump FieF
LSSFAPPDAAAVRLSLFQLMDHEMDDDQREKIRAIAQSHPDVAAAHEISDEVEARLRAAYPNAEIMIHQDPEGIEEPRASFPRRVTAQ